MEEEPKDPNILKNCVETLRHGRGYGAEWEELHGDPPLSSAAAQKFSVEFGCAAWSTWFPPSRVDLPGRGQGNMFEHRVGDEAEFRRWEAHVTKGDPLEKIVKVKEDEEEESDNQAPGHLVKTVVFEMRTRKE
jgi:hypothetical protein